MGMHGLCLEEAQQEMDKVNQDYVHKRRYHQPGSTGVGSAVFIKLGSAIKCELATNNVYRDGQDIVGG